jgi:hypothetical protein
VEQAHDGRRTARRRLRRCACGAGVAALARLRSRAGLARRLQRGGRAA